MGMIKIFRDARFGEIRTFTNESGEVMFVGKDVAKGLGYRDTVNALKKHVDDDDKGRWEIATSSGKQPMILITESGFYALVLGSKHPKAREFKHWVTSVVLPQIRETGGYIPMDVLAENPADDADTVLLAKALQVAQRTIELNEKRIQRQQDRILEQQMSLDRQQSDVEFALAVGMNGDCCSIGQLAKMIYDQGFEIGQNRLFEWMRENGYLGTVGVHYNVPHQEYVERGLFKLKICEIGGRHDPRSRTKVTPLVTGKGQRYFIDIFLNKVVA